MIGANVYGTLTVDPIERQSQAGKTFMNATLRAAAGSDALFIGVVAFDPTAAARLAQMRKGGVVAGCGVLEQTTWKAKDGESRTGWRLTASEVLTAYAATKKRRTAEGDDDA